MSYTRLTTKDVHLLSELLQLGMEMRSATCDGGAYELRWILAVNHIDSSQLRQRLQQIDEPGPSRTNPSLE